jgi:hypothetical protein
MICCNKWKNENCKVKVAKCRYLAFFFQNIWWIEKKAVPLHTISKTNKFNLLKKNNYDTRRIVTRIARA